MGIIGYGRIGQATGKIAQGFSMNVLAFDEYQNKDLECETMAYASLDEVLAKSDVISLHCPLFPSTEGMINSEEYRQDERWCDHYQYLKRSSLLLRMILRRLWRAAR